MNPVLRHSAESLPPATPTLEPGVEGPRGQVGYLLRAPAHEELAWDLENEVGSLSRSWMAELAGWWVAASYLDTVVELVLRSFPSVLVLDPRTGDRLISRDGISARQERLL